VHITHLNLTTFRPFGRIRSGKKYTSHHMMYMTCYMLTVTVHSECHMTVTLGSYNHMAVT